MKSFRYVMLAVLVLGLSGIAGATTFRVLDPTGSQGPLPAINLDGSNPFTFYSPCVPFPSEDGCFGAYNDSPYTITSISLTITDPDPTNPLSPLDCPTDSVGGTPSAFTNAPVCDLLGNTMIVTFSGGSGVGPGNTIWIAETGEPGSDFPADEPGSFTVTATPEPSSIWMALTGMGSLGYVVRRRRRI